MAADGSTRKRRRVIAGAKGGEATSRTPIEAPDSLISLAQARILDLISEGPIYGFVHGTGKKMLRDVYLDETPVTNPDGSFNFKNVIVDSRLGTQTQSPMKGFPSVENEIAVNVELTAASPFVRAINNTELDALRVMVSANALTQQDLTTGDLSGYRVQYAIDIKTDAGAYVEVINGAFDGKASTKYQRSHRIDLPAATSSWSLRVRRLTADTLDSNINDTTMIDSYTEIIDAKFRYPMSAYAGVIVDAAQFRSIPTRGYYIMGRVVQVPTNYNAFTRVYTGTWDGTFKSSWTNNPAWVYYDMVTHARYGLGHIVSASLIDKWALFGIAQYCDELVPTGEPLRLAVTTGSTSISVSATDNSFNRATGSFITDGFLAGDQVTVSGFAASNNNGRGIISEVTATKMIMTYEMDLTTAAAAAGKTIVTAVPTEPRFAASIYLQRQEEAFKVLSDLASIFRGISYWAGGAIVPVCDMPTDPSYVYTNANVKDGKFTYQGSGRRARHTVCLVSWSDPTDFGRTKVEYVDDPVGIARYGVQTTQINAIGCTSQGTARRLGRWLLLSERLLTDTCTWEVGLEGTVAVPGQIVRVADAKRAGRRIGGRVHSATLTTLTVDALSTPPPVNGDTLIMIKPDGTSIDRAITSVNVGTKTLGFATLGAGNVPVVGSPWATESASLMTQLFRVISVIEAKGSDTLSFELTGLEHDPSIFGAVDFGDALDKRRISGIAPPVQVPPTGLVISATPRAGSVLAQTFLTAHWNKAVGAVSYEIQWKGNARNWTPLQRVTGLSTQYDQGFSGKWQFRVIAIGANKRRSVPAYSSTLDVLDQTLQPTSVQDASDQAAAAAADAAAAMAEINAQASDNVLSKVEKKATITNYNTIINDKAGIDAEATNLGITTEKTNYDASITALTAYLNTLSPAWNDQTQNTPIVGSTYKSKWNDVYSKRQIVLNKIYNVQKSLSDTAQTTANTAITTANAAAADLSNMASDNVLSVVEKKRVINDWNVAVAEKAGISAQAVKYDLDADLTAYNSAYSALQTYLGTLTSPVAWNNLTNITNVVGTTFRSKWADYYQAKVVILQHIADVVMYGADYVPGENLAPNPNFTYNRLGMATNVYKAVNVALCDGWYVYPTSGGITQDAENGVLWNGTQIRCRIYGQTALAAGASRLSAFWAPNIPVQAGKSYEFGFTVTNSFNGSIPGTIDARTRASVHFYDSSGAAVGTWTAVITTLDNAANRGSGTYKGIVKVPTGISAAFMRPDFGAAVTNNAGTAYTHATSILLDAGFSNVWIRKLEDLTIPGSGYQIGDQRNLTPVRTGSTGSRWSGAAITFTIPTTGSPASVAFNVASGSLVAGSASIAYNASSGNVNQARSTTVTYYLYYIDADYSGGAKTLNITTNAANISNSDDRMWIGDAVVTTPVLGTGGSGGGGGGGSCVCSDMFIDRRLAGDINELDSIDIIDQAGVVSQSVTGNQLRISASYRIETESGIAVSAGETTPMTLQDGTSKFIGEMLGEQVLVDDNGTIRWEQVTKCDFIGNKLVSHISVGGSSYFAGERVGRRIATHNSLKP